MKLFTEKTKSQQHSYLLNNFSIENQMEMIAESEITDWDWWMINAMKRNQKRITNQIDWESADAILQAMWWKSEHGLVVLLCKWSFLSFERISYKVNMIL